MNAVATTLKGFFGDLTEPLVPVAMYDELINGSGNTQRNIISNKNYNFRINYSGILPVITILLDGLFDSRMFPDA